MSSILRTSRVGRPAKASTLGLVPGKSSIFMASRRNRGGVGGRTSVVCSLYRGKRGLFDYRFDLNLTFWGTVPSISVTIMLVSGLFCRGIWRALGPAPKISHVVLQSSCLLIGFEPWSFGFAPVNKNHHNLNLIGKVCRFRLTLDVRCIQIVWEVSPSNQLCRLGLCFIHLLIDGL